MSESISPEKLKALRISLGLSREEAGELVSSTERAWKSWELGDRNMPAAKWRLFLLLTRSKRLKLSK